MNRSRAAVVVAFILGITFGIGVTVWAQAERAALPTVSGTFTVTTDTAGNVIRSTRPDPVTLPGDALALRVVGRHHGRVVGTLVAKVGDEWMEVQFAPQDALARR